MMPKSDDQERRGRRGGTTTVTDNMVRKNFYISHEQARALSLAALDRNTTEAALVREALAAYLEE